MKKIIALALAMIFVFALAIPAFAADHTVTTRPIDSASNVPQFTPENDIAQVTYTMTGSYVVSIPASIPLTTPDANNVTVNSLMLGYGQKLTVSLTYSGELKLMQGGQQKDTLAYQLLQDGVAEPLAANSPQNVLVVEAGINGFLGVSDGAKISADITADAKYAGNYIDAVQFTITVA